MTADPSDIISLGDELLERYPTSFTGDFQTNKHRVEQLTEIRSKHVRNRLAGYITRKCSADDEPTGHDSEDSGKRHTRN